MDLDFTKAEKKSKGKKEAPKRKYKKRKKLGVRGETLTIRIPTRHAYQVGVLLGQLGVE